MARAHRLAPASAYLVAWGNAWLTGRCGFDEAVDAVEATHGPQRVAGDGHRLLTGQERPLRQLLGELSRRQLAAFRLALPAPGDPLGLTGPKEFNEHATDVGEAVVVDVADAPLGLVPFPDTPGSSYTGLRWAAFEATSSVAAAPSLAEAEQHLSLTLRDAADALLDLDTAGWRPADDDALADVRTGRVQPSLAPGYPPRAVRVASQAARLATVTRAGLDDDGGAVTRSEVTTRRAALRDLERAARRASVAAYNSLVQ